MTEPTMKEKREQIKNTYLAHTHSDEGGRFAKTTPTNVIGSSPVSYPKLQSGPWSDQPMPPEEPPLGFSVDEVPIVGESFEVEASLDRDFSLKRSLRDGVPSATGVMPRSSEPTPDTEAIRAHDPADHKKTVDRVERHSPAVSAGRHSVREGRVSPSNSNIQRRLR
jgi:hypothetical protein